MKNKYNLSKQLFFYNFFPRYLYSEYDTKSMSYYPVVHNHASYYETENAEICVCFRVIFILLSCSLGAYLKVKISRPEGANSSL